MKKCKPVSSGSGYDGDAAMSTYAGSWPHWERIAFLRSSVTPRETSSNLDNTPGYEAATSRNNPATSQPCHSQNSPFLESSAADEDAAADNVDILAVDEDEDDPPIPPELLTPSTYNIEM